jgi:hypothetical protein
MPSLLCLCVSKWLTPPCLSHATHRNCVADDETHFIDFELPPKWLWDIIDEFIYQVFPLSFPCRAGPFRIAPLLFWARAPTKCMV